MSDDDPPDGWEAHERRLWEAYRRGEWCEDVPEVRAETLRWLLVAAPRPVPGRLARLRLRGARITGTLDLAEAAVQGAIRLDSCRFDDVPCFDGGQFGVLQLKDCALPGLSAAGARVGQECEFVGCTLDGTLDLRSLTVGTRLLLDRSTVHAPDGAAAVYAQSLAVEEHFSATGLVCTGPVRLMSSRVQDTLGFRGARLQGDRACLQAPELTVGGGLYLDRGFSSDGGINLYGASIGGSLHLEDATLTGPDAPGDPALQLLCASVGGDIQAGSGLAVRGSVDMRDTAVRGSVVLRRAQLHHPAGTALRAHRLHVGGDLDCRDGFVAEGTVDLCDARVGGSALFEGAELTGRDGAAALRANGIEVGAEFNCCDGLTAHGRISLSSITVRARLCFENALLDVPAGERALICRRSAAAELTLKPREAPHGIVDLSHTRIGVLRDDPAGWPRSLVLEGLAYDSTKPALPGHRRLTWLDRDPAGFAPQPYEQLAANYRRHGRDADARLVLLAKQRRRRATLAWPARIWSLLQDLTVGYGYRPLRAVLLLAVFFTVGTVLFAAWPPLPYGDGTPPDFQPAVYTLDLLLPVVDFGQERSYSSHGAMQWAVVVLVSVGWVLASTVVAGANRVLRRS